MSTHPNAILMASFTPNDLARKTYRKIIDEHARGDTESPSVDIGDDLYHIIIMESDYHDELQVSANEGDIVVLSLVTYGYGQRLSWEDMNEKKEKLDEWSRQVCIDFDCSYEIFVTANCW